eukprot:4656189-Amphidinium_carterae.1
MDGSVVHEEPDKWEGSARITTQCHIQGAAPRHKLNRIASQLTASPPRALLPIGSQVPAQHQLWTS